LPLLQQGERYRLLAPKALLHTYFCTSASLISCNFAKLLKYWSTFLGRTIIQDQRKSTIHSFCMFLRIRRLDFCIKTRASQSSLLHSSSHSWWFRFCGLRWEPLLYWKLGIIVWIPRVAVAN
jgi:hypothetical protein